jgi:hypothetical protein
MFSFAVVPFHSNSVSEDDDARVEKKYLRHKIEDNKFFYEFFALLAKYMQGGRIR